MICFKWIKKDWRIWNEKDNHHQMYFIYYCHMQAPMYQMKRQSQHLMSYIIFASVVQLFFLFVGFCAVKHSGVCVSSTTLAENHQMQRHAQPDAKQDSTRCQRSNLIRYPISNIKIKIYLKVQNISWCDRRKDDTRCTRCKDNTRCKTIWCKDVFSSGGILFNIWRYILDLVLFGSSNIIKIKIYFQMQNEIPTFFIRTIHCFCILWYDCTRWKDDTRCTRCKGNTRCKTIWCKDVFSSGGTFRFGVIWV